MLRATGHARMVKFAVGHYCAHMLLVMVSYSPFSCARGEKGTITWARRHYHPSTLPIARLLSSFPSCRSEHNNKAWAEDLSRPCYQLRSDLDPDIDEMTNPATPGSLGVLSKANCANPYHNPGCLVQAIRLRVTVFLASCFAPENACSLLNQWSSFGLAGLRAPLSSLRLSRARRNQLPGKLWARGPVGYQLQATTGCSNSLPWPFLFSLPNAFEHFGRNVI